MNQQKKNIIEILASKYTNKPRSEAIIMIKRKLGTTGEVSAVIYNEWRKKYVSSIKM
ncbi:hypothetical protein [uncultured Clostridium sp.]|uniref:hypothetical protein n=1 Tax=uncultured Clostridium sp. TaxID=59620 RepID=UPI0025FEA0F3|nr:hypothetical protein [uncultured Clostridium sp.]